MKEDVLSENKHRPSRANLAVALLSMASWAGVAAGLLEGFLLWALQATGLATWEMIRDGVDARILIVSPLFDLVLFLIFGLLWTLVALAFRDRDFRPWALGFYSLAGFYALLASTGRLNDLACTLLALGLATQVARVFRRNPAAWLRGMQRTAPALLVLFLLAAGYVVASPYISLDPDSKRPSPPATSPNILLVVLDAVRADHLGAYGYARSTSPNFDRFAREGVLFENAYSSSSWTLPSHASLFTNLHNFENHVDPWFLDAQFLTLAESMRDAGYATGGAVGNMYWCNYATGIAQGQQFNGAYFHNLPDAISRTLFGRKAMDGVLRLFHYYRNPAKKLADRVNQEILHWLDSQPNRPQPFFAFLNYYDAHEPCFPPPPYDSRFASAEQINHRKPLDSHMGLSRPLAPARIQADLDAYDSSIAFVDAQLGALWEELQRRGLAENTVLIITSDHGHSWGEGGVYGHRTSLRREQIHVPLVFYWPGHVPAGVRVATPVSNILVPATVNELAEVGQQFRGPSLASLWRDPAAASTWSEPVLAELSTPRRNLPLKTLIGERWQYLEWPDGTAELFDFVADPREERDLSQTEEGRPVVKAMRDRLHQLLAQAPPPPAARSAPDARED